MTARAFSPRSLATALVACGLGLALPRAARADDPNPAFTLPSCESEQAEVTLDSDGKIFLVSRNACRGEQRVLLRYSRGDEAPKLVVGALKGSTWSFAILDEPRQDSIIKLEFQVLRELGADEVAAAKVAIVKFTEDLALVVKAAFDEAEVQTRNIAAEKRAEVMASVLNLKLRPRVRELLGKPALAKLATERGPASEVVLASAGFQKLSNGDWEPKPELFVKFAFAWDVTARSLTNAQQQVAAYAAEAKPHPCLGNVPLNDSDDTAEARRRAASTCLKAFLDASQGATPALPDPAAKAVAAWQARQAAGADALAKDLFQNDETRTEVLSPAAQRDLDEIQAALSRRGKKEREDGADAARDAIDYVAALALLNARKGQWVAQAIKALGIDTAALRASITFTRQARASELWAVQAGRPRFVVSTGVIVSSLSKDFGQPWKAALPVLVAICWSRSGCETKGIGSGGSFLNYVSTDVGVRVTSIGVKDARESSPSLLLGLGVAPIYALHVSAGVNVFENPQQDRLNVAPYVGVTLDLVDGADILGQLGMGKPTVEKIGEKK